MNAALLALAVLFVPQSNDDTLSQTPLDRGETAYIMRGNSATLKIGDADVIDRSALRGYKVDELDRADFVVEVTGGFTYAGATDSWTRNGAITAPLTNTITITTLRDIRETSGSIIYKAAIGQTTPPYTISINGNEAVYTIVWPTGTFNRVIRDLSVKSVAYGDPDEETDLREHIIPVIDDLGSSKLGDWRKWAKNLYNGNRGADWSRYAAVKTVDLGGNAVAFDSKAHYTFGVNIDTNLVMLAGGYSAFEVSHHGTATGTNAALRITSFNVTNLTCYIHFIQDISGFDLSKLAVFETYSLSKPIVWSALPASSIQSKADGLVVVKPQAGFNQRFLKLVYNGSIESSVVTITMNGIVNVVGDLAINNTNLVAWMSAVDSPLRGKQFDFSQMKGMYQAVSNLVYALGGTITNFPAFNQ